MPPDFRLIEFDEIDSTNAEALRQAGQGASEGAVIRANRQTAGRGRRGAQWASPMGNLHASLLVSQPDTAKAGHLAFVAAIAAGDALTELAPALAAIGYKWPNDLVFEGQKLGGILIEAAPPALYALGIGINLDSAPSDVRPAPISVRDATGLSVTPEDALAAICRHYARWRAVWARHGFGPVREAWLERAIGIGGEIEARLPDKTVHGVFSGIDEDGVLLLDLPDGSRCEVAAGAVFFSEPEAAKCC